MTHISIKLVNEQWIRGKQNSSDSIGLQIIDSTETKIIVPYTNILYWIVEGDR